MLPLYFTTTLGSSYIALGAAVGNKVAQKPLYFTMLSAQNGENCEQNKLIFVVSNLDDKSRS